MAKEPGGSRPFGVALSARMAQTDASEPRTFVLGEPAVSDGQLLTIRTVSRAAGRVVLAVEGEIDKSTAPLLRYHLMTLMDTDDLSVTVDLPRLRFTDSTGLNVFVPAQH